MQRAFGPNVRKREDDDCERGFKKQRVVALKHCGNSKGARTGRTMAAHVSVHNWHEDAGGRIGQKTFVTTCHFQPRRVPVRYTETMILHLNSAKKRYFESVAYETKMVPSHWSQTMFVDLVPGQDRVISEVKIPCDIYVPLIQQEVIAHSVAERVEAVDTPQRVQHANAAPCAKTTPTTTKVVKGEMLDNYHKNTCEEFLNEMRKMY